LANVKAEATPSAAPEPRPSSSGKTWQKNPSYTYVAKTEQQATSLAASVASLQSAIRDIKQHHETITAEKHCQLSRHSVGKLIEGANLVARITANRNVNSSLMKGWTAGTCHTAMVNTILCYAEDPHGNRVEVSVIPDTGSQENIAHSKVLKGLALETIDLGENGPKIKGVEGSKPIQLSHLSRLKLIPRGGTDRAMEAPVFLIDQPGQWSARIPKRIPNWLARRKDLADPRIVTGTSSVPIHVILES
jgi:hypothetical protein